VTTVILTRTVRGLQGGPKNGYPV